MIKNVGGKDLELFVRIFPGNELLSYTRNFNLVCQGLDWELVGFRSKLQTKNSGLVAGEVRADCWNPAAVCEQNKKIKNGSW